MTAESDRGEGLPFSGGSGTGERSVLTLEPRRRVGEGGTRGGEGCISDNRLDAVRVDEILRLEWRTGLPDLRPDSENEPRLPDERDMCRRVGLPCGLVGGVPIIRSRDSRGKCSGVALFGEVPDLLRVCRLIGTGEVMVGDRDKGDMEWTNEPLLPELDDSARCARAGTSEVGEALFVVCTRLGDGDLFSVGEVGRTRGEVGRAVAMAAMTLGMPARAGENAGVTNGEMGAMGKLAITESIGGAGGRTAVPGAGHCEGISGRVSAPVADSQHCPMLVAGLPEQSRQMSIPS